MICKKKNIYFFLLPVPVMSLEHKPAEKVLLPFPVKKPGKEKRTLSLSGAVNGYYLCGIMEKAKYTRLAPGCGLKQGLHSRGASGTIFPFM